VLTDAEVRRINGQRIAAARADLKLSRRQLGELLAKLGCGATPQSICDWELGNTSPTPARRIALATILGRTDLFHVDGDEQVA